MPQIISYHSTSQKGCIDLLVCYAFRLETSHKSNYTIACSYTRLIIRGISCYQVYYCLLIIFTFVEIDQTDLRIGEDLLFIYPSDNRTCFEIEAIDDTIIEDTEVVNVTVLPMNPNDRVMDEITSVTITDNDGIIL